MMRWPELDTGIDVFDETNAVVGTSKIAAARALRDTTLTRAVLPIPLLTVPAIVLMFLER